MLKMNEKQNKTHDKPQARKILTENWYSLLSDTKKCIKIEKENHLIFECHK